MARYRAPLAGSRQADLYLALACDPNNRVTPPYYVPHFK